MVLPQNEWECLKLVDLMELDPTPAAAVVPVHVEVVLNQSCTESPALIKERVEKLLRDQHVEFFDGDLDFDDPALRQHVQRIRISGIPTRKKRTQKLK